MRIKADKEIYTKEVLLKTAYSFTEKAYLHLSQDDRNWLIEWTGKQGCVIAPEEFENELIEQQLREELINKTADVRKMVLARAFASTVIDSSPDDEEVIEPSSSEEGQILRGWFQQDGNI